MKLKEVLTFEFLISGLVQKFVTISKNFMIGELEGSALASKLENILVERFQSEA